jgi:hypothetical protein
MAGWVVGGTAVAIALLARYQAWFEDHDVLLSPTLAPPRPP